MVKGCRKSIVYVKNTGSEYFKEAYFILNEGDLALPEERDLVREATRIIEEKYSQNEEKGKGILSRIKKSLVPFLVGLGVGLTAFLIALII